eukprot:TRINITY_DN4637_c0_g2_i1.p1 TRINITY_DN4637_c0_g2~~TRINITY_DN4637_c0_g2_i1.p1  ORF type:complete len:299 (-),score=69.32 TRINITY_DN4637_c0_g2_i1:71-967(-)
MSHNGSDNEEAPLRGAAATVAAAPKEEDHDPENDPELVKNGGKFTSKKAILQVTWRFPVEMDPLNILALIYGYLPFIVPTVFFVNLVVTRRFMPLYGLIVSGIVTCVNELILKPIFKDPRPSGSANRKFNEKTQKWEMKEGMPSGHVLNATTMLVWCVLEVALRGPGFDDQAVITWELILLIVVTTAPVPWARIHNKDHSLAQCIAGGSLGICAGIAAYFIRMTFFPLDASSEICLFKGFCLVTGKPWDDFLPATAVKVGAAAAAIATTGPPKGIEKHPAEAAAEKEGKHSKLRGAKE